MDNLGEIIILIIFIVLSMLGSLSKDKKKKEQRRTEGNDQNRYKPVQKKTGSVFDKIPADDEEYETPVYYGEGYSKTEHTTWNPEDTYKKNNNLTQKSFNTISPISSEQEAYNKRMKELDLGSKQLIPSYSKLLESNFSKKNEKNIRIRNIISNPKSLKEFILMSEILGKPKALRR